MSSIKLIRTTATAHISKINTRFIEDWQSELFKDMKDLFAQYRPDLELVANTAHHFELWTNMGYRTRSFHVRNHKGIAFCAIIIFPKHLSLYFYPLAASGELQKFIGSHLALHQTGRYTFHMATLSPELIQDLKELIRFGWSYLKENRLA